MSLVDFLTPENTQELRPGLFIQKHKGEFRVVKPLAWEGKLLIKDQIKTLFNVRTLITICLILFLAWSYTSETEYCRELKADPCALLSNITNYCSSPEYYGNKERVDNLGLYPYAIQDNP